MIGILFKAQLEDRLSAEQKQHVLDQIKKTKGVFSAQFAKASARKRSDNVISVHAGMASVESDIRKIPGVKSTTPDDRMRM